MTGARTACAARRAACGLRDSTVEYHAQIVKPGGVFGDEHRETTDFQYGFGVMTRMTELVGEVASPTSPIGERSFVDERFVLIPINFVLQYGYLMTATRLPT